MNNVELEFADRVSTKEDFVKFIEILIKDFDKNKSKWENIDIPSFLEGIKAYTDDSDIKDSSWSTFANLLLMGSIYE